MLYIFGILLFNSCIVFQTVTAADTQEQSTYHLGKGLFTEGKLIESKTDQNGVEIKYIASDSTLIKVWQDDAGRERVSMAPLSNIVKLNDEYYIVPQIFQEILSSPSPLHLLLATVSAIETISEESYAKLAGEDILSWFYPKRKHKRVQFWELTTESSERLTPDKAEYQSVCSHQFKKALIFAVKSNSKGFGCIRVLEVCETA